MATTVAEIGEIAKTCKVLLLDIEGTTTSISFVKDKLFPYAEEHVRSFLEARWEDAEVRDAVAALRALALQDREEKAAGVVDVPAEDAPKEEQITALVANVKWQMSLDRKTAPLKTLQGLVWRRGYDSGDIQGHVFDDVPPALRAWRAADGRRVYIYSSGSAAAQKLLFGRSVAGDLLPLIDGHFDTAVGGKQQAASYTKIAEEIGCKPDEILFLTDILAEAEAARAAGARAALVSRAGNAPLPPSALPVLHTLGALASKKRKPDAQDEVPAKVAKTDSETSIKSSTNDETTSAQANGKAETMDVQDSTEDKTEEPKAAAAAETTAEHITDKTDAPDAPASDAKPTVTEEKTEHVDDVEMEAEKTKTDEETKPEPAAAETATVITEIEDVTDKEVLDEVAEIIEDLVPVVEEPESVEEDMAELKNVGEVLEKECDDILAKVQDVTNLDNIAVKPLLPTVVEDASESNDAITDSILDTEIDMGMKPPCDIDLNTVGEIAETKPAEENGTDKPAENGAAAVETATEATEEVKAEPTATVAVESKTEEKTEEHKTEDKENTEAPAETKAEETANGEAHLNGNKTNGVAKVNGDSAEEAESRPAENGAVNGTNGAEQAAAGAVPDIKVKTVADTPPEPLDTATEA